MFLLVSGRHVGAHPDGHQRGVSMQISLNLVKKLLRISCIRKNCCDLNLSESLCKVTFFLFSDSGLNLLNGFDFILIYFKRRDTENQQYQKIVVKVQLKFYRELISVIQSSFLFVKAPVAQVSYF